MIDDVLKKVTGLRKNDWNVRIATGRIGFIVGIIECWCRHPSRLQVRGII